MDVFVPALKDRNSFFDEVTYFSKNKFHYAKLSDSIDGFQYVLIQWIEQLFDWNLPTEAQICFLEERIHYWKKNKVQIIHIMHNERPHSGTTLAFERLYELVLSNTDVIIHFGFYGLNKYKNIYKQATHVQLEHPLYSRSYIQGNKAKARAKLGVEENKIVFIIPGKVRNLKERKYILDYFFSIPLDNKILIAPRMYFSKMNGNQKGYYFLKKHFPKVVLARDILLNRKLKNNRLIIDDKFIENDELALYMNASDIVWSPRLNTLNSGIVYLGLTFNKLVLAPCIGNIKEVVEGLNLPTYIPGNKKSFLKSSKEIISLLGEESVLYHTENMKKYKPEIIAKQLDALLFDISKK